MKQLEKSSLEVLKGGEINCAEGIGIVIGLAAAAVVGAAFTGGASFGMAYLLIVNGGTALALENCAN